ncbi:zinc-ribbon domain-containing protein [Cellulosimicrobium sp. CUA-896]|uniref:zinc-ribbon domain-containing protein n=1 Tax=Cellulosimicrobium sp. CUA-896 TaxID=1517881 RepID=UPI000AEB0B64|nr:zinc-ribbon domain-containing protein [Cellulosimicrobium sp. CUA-896]
MSPVVCPNGHASTATDYCDVCGAPLAAATAPSASVPGSAAAARPAAPTPGEEPTPPAPAGATCPHCGAQAPAGALFCENCGYDFTTGALPEPVEPPSALSLDPPAASTPAANTPAASTPAAGTPPPSTPGPGAAASGTAAAPDETPSTGGTRLPTPAVPGPDQWVVEIWIDPDWYAAQQPEDPMPSAGLPGLVVLRERSVLVGRPSVSRGIHPQVDCGADTGVSRRHCQLSTDGSGGGSRTCSRPTGRT